MWDMMSRGSFNGPGGQHTRWQIPPTQGGALGAQHNLRNKRFLNFISDDDILRLNRDGLAQSGLAVAEVKAREVAPNGELAGVRVTARRRGRQRTRRAATRPTRPARARGTRRPPATRSTARFNDYTMEVVQQIGSDSFAPGHGVLIGKSKNSNSTCGSFSCFVWYIDSNPQDINQVDYVKADGTPVKATIGDERQTNDGSFNVGLNSGRTYEYKADGQQACTSTSSTSARTPRASCTTRSASARSTAPARRRAASRSARRSRGTAEGYTTCTFPLTNTGAAAATAERAPAGRVGVPQQRHLPPVGDGHRAPAGRRI